MPSPTPPDSELLAAWIRGRGLPLEPQRAEALAPPAASLLGRAAALAQDLAPADAPPPSGPERPLR